MRLAIALRKLFRAIADIAGEVLRHLVGVNAGICPLECLVL